MNRSLRTLSAVIGISLLFGSAASPQTTTVQSGSQTATATTASDESAGPAATTFFGDTGLWFVPTAEVLPAGKWSVSGYRAGTNYVQGYTNVGDFAGTFAFGIRNRLELFGSFLVDTRIDRDVRPLLVDDPDFGGIIDRHPRVHTGWTGDHVGDLYLGVKINFWSEVGRIPQRSLCAGPSRCRPATKTPV